MDWWTQLWNENDAERFTRGWTHDAVCIGSRGTSFRGPDAIFTYARNSDRMSSDWTITATFLVEEDDRFAVEWLFEGTHDRDNQLIGPATGRRYSFPGTSIGRRRGDHIERQADYWDTLGFLVTAGVVTLPGRSG